jgi:single stranded DNA-binding protein
MCAHCRCARAPSNAPRAVLTAAARRCLPSSDDTNCLSFASVLLQWQHLHACIRDRFLICLTCRRAPPPHSDSRPSRVSQPWQPLALEAAAFASGCPRKMGQEKRRFKKCLTVLSVARQRSWKNAEGEWVSKVEWHRIAIFRSRLSEAVLINIKKGAHVLVEGSLISSTYEQANGKGKKTKSAKITSWAIRADVVRKLDRGEQEPQAPASGTSEHSSESPEGGTF